MSRPPALANSRHWRGALLVVALYAGIASLWVLASDYAVGQLFDDPDSRHFANTLKGLLFVAVTSVLLFAVLVPLLRHDLPDQPPPATPGPRQLIFGILALSTAFALVGTAAIRQNVAHHREMIGENLTAIARLKVAQIESWMEERRRDGELLHKLTLHRRALAEWRGSGDPALARLLGKEFEDFRIARHYRSITLHDADGRLLLQAGESDHPVAPALIAAIREALADDQIRSSDLFRMDEPAPPHTHLDFVVPLPNAGAAIVLRTDVDASLYALLRAWPLPSASAECLLFRRDGADVLFLNELRHEKNSALRKRVPLAQADQLTVQALRPGHRPEQLLAGVDYRSVAVLGSALPVAGTNWWLAAKVDSAELFSESHKDTWWISIANLLTWAFSIALLVLYFLRRELLHARRQHHAQHERIQALRLLEAIAGSSSDTIYAKDTDGRYLLFNHEAARLAGRPADQVIGHDDSLLFPPEEARQLRENDLAAMHSPECLSFEEHLSTVDGQAVYLSTKGPLRDADGRLLGLFGIARDITAMKRTEQALRAERDLKQRYLDTVQTLMIALDTAGRITMINRFGCQLLASAENELLGRNWSDNLRPEDRPAVAALVDRLLGGAGHGVEETEYPICDRLGRLHGIAWRHTTLTDDSGRVIGLLASGEDVTERRQAEAQLLRQAAELSARNAELERFNRAMIGRELDLIELKRQINALSVELGRPAPFDLSALEPKRSEK